MEEVAQWVEENKLHICHNVTVDDLHHLHRGGRISKATAVLGSMVQIKPIIHVDNEGRLQVIGKERGRKKSLNKIVDMAAEQAKGWENDLVLITHGDCIEEAEYVAGRVREKLGVDHILINNIGTVIGSIPDRELWLYSVWVRKIEQKEVNRETVKRVVKKQRKSRGCNNPRDFYYMVIIPNAFRIELSQNRDQEDWSNPFDHDCEHFLLLNAPLSEASTSSMMACG